VAGPYLNYTDEVVRPRRKAKQMNKGDVVNFPKEYGNGLVESGLIKPYRNLVQKSFDAVGDTWNKLSDKISDGSLPTLPIATVQIEVTNAAKKLADEYGIDLADITGTGTDGKILKGDVADYINQN
jgi:hypothetical protein